MSSLLRGGPPVSTIQGRNDKEGEQEKETDTERDREGGMRGSVTVVVLSEAALE